jgi:biopolymer transport protein ExbB
MSLPPAPLAVFGQFVSGQPREWEKLADAIGYLSGPARSVILCLIAMFLVSVAASIERFALYLAVRRATRRFIRETKRAFLEQDDEAVKRGAAENARSHIATLTDAALSGYASARVMVTSRDAVELSVRQMERSKSLLARLFKRRLALLASIASTAPLVGLLGTVFAILDSARGFSMSHAAAVSMMAGASADALMTTAIGMFVAVPAVWSYNYWSERSEIMLIEMEVAARELKTYLVKRGAKESVRLGGARKKA